LTNSISCRNDFDAKKILLENNNFVATIFFPLQQEIFSYGKKRKIF